MIYKIALQKSAEGFSAYVPGHRGAGLGAAPRPRR